MRVPQFVRRAVLRASARRRCCLRIRRCGNRRGRGAGAVGGDLEASRQRIENDVRQQFGTLSSRLEMVVSRLRADATVLSAASTRDIPRTRELFDSVAQAATLLDLPGVAITVYGPEARPIAWTGRPSTLPVGRIIGPEALFLAPSPLGLRLTRVAPVSDPMAPERRAATIVAEAPLPRTEDIAHPGDSLIVATSVVPVPITPGSRPTHRLTPSWCGRRPANRLRPLRSLRVKSSMRGQSGEHPSSLPRRNPVCRSSDAHGPTA